MDRIQIAVAGVVNPGPRRRLRPVLEHPHVQINTSHRWKRVENYISYSCASFIHRRLQMLMHSSTCEWMCLHKAHHRCEMSNRACAPLRHACTICGSVDLRACVRALRARSRRLASTTSSMQFIILCAQPRAPIMHSWCWCEWQKLFANLRSTSRTHCWSCGTWRGSSHVPAWHPQKIWLSRKKTRDVMQ